MDSVKQNGSSQDRCESWQDEGLALGKHHQRLEDQQECLCHGANSRLLRQAREMTRFGAKVTVALIDADGKQDTSN